MKEEFLHLAKAMQGFFLKQIVGYAPKAGKETYPFPVFRARHKAAAELEGEGLFSGDTAQCRSQTKSSESSAKISAEESPEEGGA